MPLHFESADGLASEKPAATRGFTLNHTMLRVKSPQASLRFYTEVLGMQLLRRLDFEEMRFSLYFLGFVDEHQAPPAEAAERTRWTFSQAGILELTHNWGSEDDNSIDYHNGNDAPKGFGHLGINVPDLALACEHFDRHGVRFIKRPEDGKMPGIAFIGDPDGYWIEILQADRLSNLG
jgi:lactoylglutathione lyase